MHVLVRPLITIDGITHWGRGPRVMADKTVDEFAPPRARRNGLPRGPHDVHAHYGQSATRIIVRWRTGAEIGFASLGEHRLEIASASRLEVVGLEAFGIGWRCGAVGRDLCVPGSGNSILGSHRWMVARRGARGSHVGSPARAPAPRENGSGAGQPRPAGA
jgi:hypothetical protein